jgi:hypothetical protein
MAEFTFSKDKPNRGEIIHIFRGKEILHCLYCYGTLFRVDDDCQTLICAKCKDLMIFPEEELKKFNWENVQF